MTTFMFTVHHHFDTLNLRSVERPDDPALLLVDWNDDTLRVRLVDRTRPVARDLNRGDADVLAIKETDGYFFESVSDAGATLVGFMERDKARRKAKRLRLKEKAEKASGLPPWRDNS